MNVERKGVLSPSLFISTVSCSTNLIGRCLNLYITHLHSSFYQLPTHNQAHRCICSCPACSHSVAHIHHCLAENIHPFLSRGNQNKSHFPNQPNPLYKVPCKDFTLLYSHLPIGFGFVCFVSIPHARVTWATRNQPIMVPTCMELWEAIPCCMGSSNIVGSAWNSCSFSGTH